MPTVASDVPFFQLCVILDKINKKAAPEKKKVMKTFVDDWREQHKKIYEGKETEDSFFPAMRLLLPQLERERDAYGIKEVVLAKLYIDILGLGKNSPAAEKLLNYRAPKSAKADAGDFALVCFTVLQTRCPEKGSLSVEEVNKYLDQVALCNANKDKAGQKKALEHMLRKMSAREQKWLIRMILKELKMGLSQQSILSLFHQDAEDLYNVKMSLRKVCEMLRDPTVRLHEIQISLFSVFSPMLGDRAQPKKIEKLMNNQPYIIETKFDGERVQLHKKEDEYKYFSRGGHEYTNSFGKDKYTGSFTPNICSCFKSHIKNCILDGEMVGYDPSNSTIGTKGQSFDVKALNENSQYQPMMCAFDVVMVNDQVLSNKPLRERKKILSDVFDEIPGRIILSQFKEGKTKEDCIEALNEAIDNREEGIMIKNPETPYKPNDRKGGWFKVKPDYLSGVMDELDVIVVGGMFGAGHRSTILSHFLCAVAVPPSISGAGDDKPTQFLTFCRVGSGYTKSELYDFNKKLKDFWKPFNANKPPKWLKFAPGYKQKPDCIIQPDKSCILQIRAAEITASDQFATECTLRFPRVEKIRDDKQWYDCMTTTELDDLKDKSQGKLAGKLLELEDDDDESPKKKRRKVTTTTRQVKPTVMDRFRAADVSNVKKVSEILNGKEICIINGTTDHPKGELEQKVAEYGGSIVQNPGDNTFCVLAEKVAIKVRNIINKSKYDVVKVSWLLKCIEQQSFITWQPSDMIHTSLETNQEFAKGYDQHGDSYFDDTTASELQKVFTNIGKEEAIEQLTTEDIADIEAKYFPHDSYYGLFRPCCVYMDIYKIINDIKSQIKDSNLELVSTDLCYHGARVSAKLDGEVSYVVVAQSDLSRVQELRNLNKKRKKMFHIVTDDWVTDSIEKEKLLLEKHYNPPNSVEL